MSFKAKFYCPVDAEYCSFSIWEEPSFHTKFELSADETHVENVGENSVYVGVKNGSADGLKNHAKPVSGGTNATFLS